MERTKQERDISRQFLKLSDAHRALMLSRLYEDGRHNDQSMIVDRERRKLETMMRDAGHDVAIATALESALTTGEATAWAAQYT